LKPERLLLDLAMPKHPGLDALRELSVPTNASPVQVILLASRCRREKPDRGGAVTRRSLSRPQGLGYAVIAQGYSVMAGEYWIGREGVLNLVQYFRTLMPSSHDEARENIFRILSRHELEVVSAVFEQELD
jgi:two-component system, NarL family, nitrate/nitrite response regulator NarL